METNTNTESYFVVSAPGTYGNECRVAAGPFADLSTARFAAKRSYACVVRRGDKAEGETYLRCYDDLYPVVPAVASTPTCWFVVMTDLSPSRATVMAVIPGSVGRAPAEVSKWMDGQPTRALKVVFGAQPQIGARIYR